MFSLAIGMPPQPYFFPYLGYYQLINNVDLFVFFQEKAPTQKEINDLIIDIKDDILIHETLTRSDLNSDTVVDRTDLRILDLYLNDRALNVDPSLNYDVNGDGNRDLVDVFYLEQLIKNATDVNGDGIFSVLDIMRVDQMIGDLVNLIR